MAVFHKYLLAKATRFLRGAPVTKASEKSGVLLFSGNQRPLTNYKYLVDNYAGVDL
ncbi:hypothetical protein [Anaerosporomusa subterranea]|uniref:hypothetical protein n=1 Tax=Anaerosporomusa subterranea TaxID=1794912 RepID=UPI0012E7E7E9|nr:hypothetical protein [Anaerosporomusa subterranea]